MSPAVKLAIRLTIAVLSVVTGNAEDSCQDLESIDPCDMNALLEVEFGRCGVRVTPHRAQNIPSVAFEEAKPDENYVLVMVDPDAPSRKNPKYRYWRHLVMSDISGSSLQSGNPQGTFLTEYAGPSPPQKSGPHRYRLFLFEQHGPLKSVKTLGNDSRGKWNLHDFVSDNHLCNSLVAGYEFISENE